MRILYVEDNPANLFLIKRVAKMGDHEVINLIDGEEALRKIDIIKPDLILMDIQLAGQLTGLDVVRKLRQDGLTVPIVAVTAYAMVGDRERCLEAGCNEYLSKPLPIGRVVELLQLYQAGIPAAGPVNERDEVYLPLDRSAETPTVPAVPTETAPAAPLASTPAEAAPPVAPAAPVSETPAAAPAPTETLKAPDAPAAATVSPAAPALPGTPESDAPPTLPSVPAPTESTASGETLNATGLSTPSTSQGEADLSVPLDASQSPAATPTGEPPLTLPGTDSLSDPAVESTSQDTSHPQDTVQAQ